MRLATRDVLVEGMRFQCAYLLDDEVRLDGHYTSAPHTEGKLSLVMDFDEAQSLIKDLQEVLKNMPCPHCHRKGA